ncbi:hypothetical protein K2173_003104 [Erythroxylum novogranatense]|uniref:RNase H type-1 domain-containing protein n=1 Tax=Erythroxylum novogranatense TaxID=1862640 RepID=A0AAV8T9Y4_9ROSI|nr:hypothetical protein K2173_003104 [Erythroxylum novogranatense]
MLWFLTGCWVIWCARNKAVLNDESLSTGTQRLWHRSLMQECLSVFNSGAHLVSHRPPRWIAWTKPPPGFVKLNTNGSAVGNPGQARYGGLIRDMEGRWLAGFSGSIGIATNILAKLQGLKHGLQLMWDLGYRSVLVKTDCLVVVNLVFDSPQPYHPRLVLIRDIQDMFAKQWRCSLHHVLREGNHCADFLAKIGLSQLPMWSYWSTPPPGLRLHLEGNCQSIVFLRT